MGRAASAWQACMVNASQAVIHTTRVCSSAPGHAAVLGLIHTRVPTMCVVQAWGRAASHKACAAAWLLCQRPPSPPISFAAPNHFLVSVNTKHRMRMQAPRLARARHAARSASLNLLAARPLPLAQPGWGQQRARHLTTTAPQQPQSAHPRMGSLSRVGPYHSLPPGSSSQVGGCGRDSGVGGSSGGHWAVGWRGLLCVVWRSPTHDAP